MTVVPVIPRGDPRAPRAGRVDLLKLDIEGAEYDVLYGAAPETLARIREIRMEAHDLDGERPQRRGAADVLRPSVGFAIVHDRAEPDGVGHPMGDCGSDSGA